MQLHYCMGKFISWEFGNKDTDDCGNCGMHKAESKSNNCCTDIIKKIESCKEHKQVESFSTSLNYSEVDIPSTYLSNQALLFSVIESKPIINCKLEYPQKCILDLYCTYLI